MILSRRSLITGLASFLAAPAIVRASTIMPVKAWTKGGFTWVDPLCDEALPLIYRKEFIRAFEEQQHLLRAIKKDVYRITALPPELIFAQS